jgi:hypothetical protein
MLKQLEEIDALIKKWSIQRAQDLLRGRDGVGLARWQDDGCLPAMVPEASGEQHAIWQG